MQNLKSDREYENIYGTCSVNTAASKESVLTFVLGRGIDGPLFSTCVHRCTFWNSVSVFLFVSRDGLRNAVCHGSNGSPRAGRRLPSSLTTMKEALWRIKSAAMSTSLPPLDALNTIALSNPMIFQKYVVPTARPSRGHHAIEGKSSQVLASSTAGSGLLTMHHYLQAKLMDASHPQWRQRKTNRRRAWWVIVYVRCGIYNVEGEKP